MSLALSKMDPFESYKLYNALKLHFETDGYDAVKYRYKTRVNPQSFFKRRDKYFFAKLGKTYGKDLVKYYVSNFIKDVKYVGDMLGPDGEANYNDMVKVHESLSYKFKNDINILSSMVNSFDELLECQDNEYPVVIKALMQEEICLETVVILNKLTRFMDKADKQITETIMWPDISRKVHKYDPYVSIDRDKMIKVVTKSFTN